ncbi:hypothetical protein [Parascardovia denticolens]|nr:hypothetical protein [Parascardovia denticolens]
MIFGFHFKHLVKVAEEFFGVEEGEALFLSRIPVKFAQILQFEVRVV